MLGFAFVVDHWLNYAGRLSKHCRQNEAEFPAARTANKRQALRGLPAADGVSFDALRPNDNWVNIEDQYEISFIREKFAAFARRIPTEGATDARVHHMRAPRTPPKKSLLAENYRGIFRKRKNEACGIAEWCASPLINRRNSGRTACA